MNKNETLTVGLIGIGLLGTEIAERLLGAGHAIVGFDASEDRRAALTDLGGQRAESAADVARRCKLLILSLPDSETVLSVISSIAHELQDGTRIVDTTTGSPNDSGKLAIRLKKQNVDFLDATVAGSSEQVRRGEAVVLVGGDRVAYESSSVILKEFSAKQFHLGPSGSGAKMKLVVNLAIGLHRAVLAEALAFGESFGFESKDVLEVLMACPSYSKAMDVKGKKMATNDFAPQARLRQHLKDVRLILEAGEDNAAQLPFSSLHEKILAILEEQGHGDEDNSAVIRHFRNEK